MGWFNHPLVFGGFPVTDLKTGNLYIYIKMNGKKTYIYFVHVGTVDLEDTWILCLLFFCILCIFVWLHWLLGEWGLNKVLNINHAIDMANFLELKSSPANTENMFTICILYPSRIKPWVLQQEK